MEINPIKREEANVQLFVEVERQPIEGNASRTDRPDFDGQMEENICDLVRRGVVWAWASVTLVASWGLFEGKAHRHCCSYGSEEDFRQNSGQYYDMVNEAMEDLNRKVNAAYQQLKEREKAA